MDNHFTIVIDTREQTPFNFGDLPVAIKSLDTGDYSIAGLEELVAIERKSLPDIVGCCGKSRDRFKRELLRLKSYRYKGVIIEATYSKMQSGEWKSTIKPSHVLGSIASWCNRYQIPFYFAGSHEQATEWCYLLLKSAHSQVVEYFRKLKVEN